MKDAKSYARFLDHVLFDMDLRWDFHSIDELARRINAASTQSIATTLATAINKTHLCTPLQNIVVRDLTMHGDIITLGHNIKTSIEVWHPRGSSQPLRITDSAHSKLTADIMRDGGDIGRHTSWTLAELDGYVGEANRLFDIFHEKVIDVDKMIFLSDSATEKVYISRSRSSFDWLYRRSYGKMFMGAFRSRGIWTELWMDEDDIHYMEFGEYDPSSPGNPEVVYPFRRNFSSGGYIGCREHRELYLAYPLSIPRNTSIVRS